MAFVDTLDGLMDRTRLGQVAFDEGAAQDLSHILGPILKRSEELRTSLPEESPLRNLVDEIENAGRKAAAIFRSP